jgi:hypothetical protein
VSWSFRKFQLPNRRIIVERGDLMLALEQIKQELQKYEAKLDEMSVSL